MDGNKEEFYSLNDVASHIKSFVRYLFKRWWLLVLITLAGAALGATYYYIQKPKYKAVCTFIVEEKQSSLGGLSSIASQFGFDIGGASGGNLFAGDNILDILKSRKIVQQVLLSPVDEVAAKGATLGDKYLEFTRLKEKWQKWPALEEISFSNTNAPMSTIQDSVLNIIYEGVTRKNLVVTRINKKGTIIKVQVNAPNDVFAKLMTERLVDEASKMYVNIKTGTAQANINRMQRRSDSLLTLLDNKSYVAASVQQLDANPGIKSAIVPTEIAMRNKTVVATLYTEVTKNLEASKMLLSQQMPVIQILDKPGLSLYDNKKSLSFLIIISAAFSAIIYVFFSIAVYFIRGITYR